MKMRTSNVITCIGNIRWNSWQRHFNKLGVYVPIIKWMIVTPSSVHTSSAYYLINPVRVKAFTYTATTTQSTHQYNRLFTLQHPPDYYLRSVRRTTSTFATTKVSSSHVNNTSNNSNNNNERYDVRNKINSKAENTRKQKRRFANSPNAKIQNIPTNNENFQLQQQVQTTLFKEIVPGIIQHECILDHNTKDNCSDDINVVSWTILVGVSGGCDSTALLHLLNSIIRTEKENIRQSTVKSGRLSSKKISNDDSIEHIFNTIHVVHFDHQQRNIESDLDRKFVQTLCEQQLNVPFYCFKYIDRDVASNDVTTTEPKQFTQEDARDWRRKTMRTLLHQIISDQQQSEESKRDNLEQTSNGTDQLRRKHIGLLVTAHHQDDSDETLLLKLLRGVHITNLHGLPSFVQDYCANESEGTKQSLHDRNDAIDFFTSPTTYWIRPLIHVTKDEITSYMQSNKYAWREDSSNQSNKYVRNRVRNELIPLMNDILSYKRQKEDYLINNLDNRASTSLSSSSNKLHKRLETLQKQSLEIRNDLDARVQDYLHQSNSWNSDVFYLHTPNEPKSVPQRKSLDFYRKHSIHSDDKFFEKNKLLLKHALFRWIHQRKPTLQIPYERIESIMDQIIQYPTRNRWAINIGHGYNIERYGNALQLNSESESITEENTDAMERSIVTNEYGNIHSTLDKERTKLNWSVILGNTNGSDDNNPIQRELLQIVIQKPITSTIETDTSIQFEYAYMDETRYRDSKNNLQPLGKHPFTPSWRRGHSPIPLSDFLRGQRVPLDRRKDSAVILMLQGTSTHTSTMYRVVAVYVDAKEKWVLDAEFVPSDESPNEDNTILIGIHLPTVR